MKRGLIGHTGFVGSNLLDQGDFDSTYNSKNFKEMTGQSYDQLWCSGVSAVKWWANQNPEEDWASIEILLDVLKTVKAKQFILISTVDVYKDSSGVTEDDPVTSEGHHPYGAHRVKVEEFVKEHFPKHLIIRLPGLFGNGLKKNIIYDFMNDNEVHKIHSENVFQFYGLDSLYQDAMLALEKGLPIVNFATEPVSVKAVAKNAFDMDFDNEAEWDPVSYDMQTQFAEEMNGDGAYLRNKHAVLDEIRAFVERTMAGR